MSSMPVFVNGQQGSASMFEEALTTVQNLGSSVLEALTSAQVDTLIAFNVRLEAINARRTRASRVISPQQAVKFVVSDFTDVSQDNTVATVRANSSSASLKERAIPAEAVIQSNTFTANTGSIEALDAAATLMRVSTFDGTIPTGTFNITLVTSLKLNHFIIDTVASPSTPTIVVSVSQDGLTYTQATQIAISGYVVNVYLPSTIVKYVRIQITPAMSDELNGDSYTFGITSFSAQATEYYLRSDLLTKVTQFTPKSEYVVFNAVSDPNIQYYLSIWVDGNTQAPFVEISPGDAVQIGEKVTTAVMPPPFQPNFLANITSELYPSTLSVTEGGVPSKVTLGLAATDPNIANMQGEYVSAIESSLGYELILINAANVYHAPRHFVVSYVYGGALINVQLKARLTTLDSSTTPIFSGASLDEK